MHTCTHALIRCMDFRLQKAIDEYMTVNNLVGDCDMISVAGVGKDIIANPDGFVATQVSLSKKLHDTKTVLLIHHMDCGAYGGHDAFESREAEKNFQIEEMKKAAIIIIEKQPGMVVKMLLADHLEDGSFKVVEV